MAGKVRKKPGSGRTLSIAAALVILAVLVGGYQLYTCLYPEEIRFDSITMTKNGEPLKLLQGETAKFHPSDICKIQEYSTNICFNYGIRLVSTGMDITGLLYEESALSDILHDKDILNTHHVLVEVKYEAEVVGSVELIIEPNVNDWIDKAKRSIGSERKIAVLERAVNSGFDDRQITDMLADEYLAVSEWNKAAALLEKIAGESEDQDVLLKLLNLYETVKNKGKTIDTIKRLIKLNPDDISLKYKLAEIYENSGKVNDAIDEYNSLLEKAPKEDLAWIYKTLGYLYNSKKWPKNAIKNYLKALELDKEDINLYYNLSELYERTGDMSTSRKFLDMAIEKQPGDVESRLKMAEGLIKKDQYTNAEPYLKEVLKAKPDSIEALLMLAEVEEVRGNKKQLKVYYKKILSLVPDNKTVIFNLGVLEYETKSYKSAKDYFLKYLKAKPNDTDAGEYLFDIYRKEKDDKSAYSQAVKILDKDPKKKQYYGFIFDYLNKKKDFKTMAKIMDSGLKKNPDDSDIRKFLVIAYLNTGKEKEAVSLIENSLKKDSKNLPALVQLAELYEKLGRINDALDTYKKILDISPDDEKAQEEYLRLRLEALE